MSKPEPTVDLSTVKPGDTLVYRNGNRVTLGEEDICYRYHEDLYILYFLRYRPWGKFYPSQVKELHPLDIIEVIHAANNCS